MSQSVIICTEQNYQTSLAKKILREPALVKYVTKGEDYHPMLDGHHDFAPKMENKYNAKTND